MSHFRLLNLLVIVGLLLPGSASSAKDAAPRASLQPAPAPGWRAGEAFCDPVSEIPQAECTALEALYNSTDGSNWTDHTGWLATTTPCSWYGITCDSGHVIQIILDSNQLSGSLPPALGSLAALQQLFMEGNQLSGVIPPELGDLTALQGLHLAATS